jgi:hypothetical protein
VDEITDDVQVNLAGARFGLDTVDLVGCSIG